MDDDILIPFIIFGSVLAVILMPIYWRWQMRKRVLETVRDMAKEGSPMSSDLVASLMAPLPANRPSLPSRQRDIRLGYILIALAIGIAFVGIAAYVIAFNTGGAREAPAVGAGVAAIGAIPGCIGIALLLLGLNQKPE
jgi:hypothetical protein